MRDTREPLADYYEGDEGQVSEVVELEGAEAEPVRRLPRTSSSGSHGLRSRLNCRSGTYQVTPGTLRRVRLNEDRER